MPQSAPSHTTRHAPYPQHWHHSDSQAASSSSSSIMAAYTLDSVMEISNDSHPKTAETMAGSVSSFRRTLFEIEDTFYRTFPAAAQAQRWGAANGDECDNRDIIFFSRSGGTKAVVNASESLSFRPAAFASAPTGRNHVASDVHMGELEGALHIGLQGRYSASAATQSSTVSGPSYTSDPVPVALASPPYTAVSGGLSDACRVQSGYGGAQNSYTSPYVTSNPAHDKGRVPPMASLTCPPASAPADLLSQPIAAAPPNTHNATSLLCQYPIQSIPRAISVPPSPRSIAPGFYPAVSRPQPTTTPNHLHPYHSHSPDPSASPPAITLYPVPQAPRTHGIPPWPTHEQTPEPPQKHSPRDASSSRSSRRKRGKDNDKKPPLACLFCRGRKIACGPPVADGDGKTCNQCHRRSLKCDYPAESRRGMRKDKTLPNLNTGGGGAKVIMKSKKR